MTCYHLLMNLSSTVKKQKNPFGVAWRAHVKPEEYYYKWNGLGSQPSAALEFSPLLVDLSNPRRNSSKKPQWRHFLVSSLARTGFMGHLSHRQIQFEEFPGILGCSMRNLLGLHPLQIGNRKEGGQKVFRFRFDPTIGLRSIRLKEQSLHGHSPDCFPMLGAIYEGWIR